MNEEIWIDIKGFEGLYQISSFGRIQHLPRRTKNTFIDYRLLKPQKDKDNYIISVLFKNKKRTTVKIHRLVATHFIDNPLKKPEVNHKDGNKQNSHVDNLEWMTAKENCKHAMDNGLKPNQGAPKLSRENVNYIRASNCNQYKLAKIFGVSQSNISAVKNNLTWK